MRLRDIEHRFGAVEVLKGTSLEASPGDVVCLFGPSGCGKTTLLRIAAGLEPLQAGTVEIDDRVIARPGSEVQAEKRPVGFVFQDYVLFPHMDVGQNIAFGLSGSKRDIKQIVSDQLSSVGLEGFEKRYPHELSGGQQQRVAIARALARSPKALLLDEPFASIDTVLRRRLREDLRRLLKAEAISVVLVTHDPEEALALADRIALMRDGAIIETATPEDLFTSPQTPEGASIFPDSQLVRGKIVNGVLKTPFGDFASSELNEGPGVAVIRQRALSAVPDSNGLFHVVDKRFVGPGWAVFVSSNGDQLIKIMMPAPLETGTALSLSADPAGVFVFPVS